MSEVTFDRLYLVHLLWLVAALAGVGVWALARKRHAMRLFADERLLGVIAPRRDVGLSVARLVFVGLSLASCVAAMMGPSWGEEQRTVVTRGIDVMVLLDVSRSMLAKDIAPNRLERAKSAIGDDLLPAMAGDRVGLIAFAGAATLKCPLTNDYGFFRLALDEISTASAPVGGTLIGDAIRKAAECFKNDEMENNKLILLITDGEDHDSFPIDAARVVWQEQKIPVVAVGLGDATEGARIPVRTDKGETYVEHGGKTVWSKADFEQLRGIADASDFKFFVPVGTRNFDLGDIYRKKLLPAIRYSERSESQKTSKPSRYHPFAVAALVLLLIDSLLREGRSAAIAKQPAARERSKAA